MLIEPIIPFRIKTLPLPDSPDHILGFGQSNTLYGSTKDEILKNLYSKTNGKVWTVAGIKANPRYNPRLGEEPTFIQLDRRDPNSQVFIPRELPCNLFLLVRNGETPIWWPDICCEVVEEPEGCSQSVKENIN